MGATFKIINSRVGEGGQTRGIEVKRIQQLLTLAGCDPGPVTGEWNPATKKAWMDFQASLNWGPVKPCIEREDPYFRLFTLAYTAGVLLDLPNNLRSKSAALALYQTCRERNIPYGWADNGGHVYNGGTRSVWGFEGNPGYAVAARGRSTETAEFDLCVPFTLNCTAFANLMLSVWMQGNAHSAPYDFSQQVGGFNPLALRYGMREAPGFYVLNPPGLYKDLKTIESVVEPGRIYYLGSADNRGFIFHDMILIDGLVYECNTYQTPAVFTTPLSKKIRQLGGHFFTLYGPGPF